MTNANAMTNAMTNANATALTVNELIVNSLIELNELNSLGHI